MITKERAARIEANLTARNETIEGAIEKTEAWLAECRKEAERDCFFTTEDKDTNFWLISYYEWVLSDLRDYKAGNIY